MEEDALMDEALEEDNIYSRSKQLFSVSCYDGGGNDSGRREGNVQEGEDLKDGLENDNLKYLYRTNLFIDWDRRTTLSKKNQFMSSMRFEEEAEMHARCLIETKEGGVDKEYCAEPLFLSKTK